MSDYTREQILSMQGRELDLIIEKTFFGLELTYEDDPNGVWESDGVDEQQKPINLRFVKVKPYSTDLYAAWEVVEKVKGNHDLFNVTFNGRWYVTIEDVIVDEENIVTDVKSYQYDHDNLPIALCKASLLAVMGL